MTLWNVPMLYLNRRRKFITMFGVGFLLKSKSQVMAWIQNVKTRPDMRSEPEPQIRDHTELEIKAKGSSPRLLLSIGLVCQRLLFTGSRLNQPEFKVWAQGKLIILGTYFSLISKWNQSWLNWNLFLFTPLQITKYKL